MSSAATKDFIKLLDLVEAGDLPPEAIPRLAYFGHKLLHGIHVPKRTYKCVACKVQYTVMDDLKSDPVVFGDCTCPDCGTKDDVYDITGDDRLGRWQCVECQYEWTSPNGYVCPMCRAEKDVPNRSCEHCGHKWKAVESSPCPECGK